MDIVVLNMVFDNSRVPDFGDIDFFGDGSKNIILTAQDIPKLNGTLTRSVCVGTYNTANFSIENGCVAVVPESQRYFMYERSTDHWYELG